MKYLPEVKISGEPLPWRGIDAEGVLSFWPTNSRKTEHWEEAIRRLDLHRENPAVSDARVVLGLGRRWRLKIEVTDDLH